MRADCDCYGELTVCDILFYCSLMEERMWKSPPNDGIVLKGLCISSYHIIYSFKNNFDKTQSKNNLRLKIIGIIVSSQYSRCVYICLVQGAAK